MLLCSVFLHLNLKLYLGWITINWYVSESQYNSQRYDYSDTKNTDQTKFSEKKSSKNRYQCRNLILARFPQVTLGVSVRVYVCACVRAYVCMCVRACVCMCVCVWVRDPPLSCKVSPSYTYIRPSTSGKKNLACRIIEGSLKYYFHKQLSPAQVTTTQVSNYFQSTLARTYNHLAMLKILDLGRWHWPCPVCSISLKTGFLFGHCPKRYPEYHCPLFVIVDVATDIF